MGLKESLVGLLGLGEERERKVWGAMVLVVVAMGELREETERVIWGINQSTWFLSLRVEPMRGDGFCMGLVNWRSSVARVSFIWLGLVASPSVSLLTETFKTICTRAFDSCTGLCSQFTRS